MLRGEYVEAVEMQLSFLRHLKERDATYREHFSTAPLRDYQTVLEHADTFYMDRHFTQLVDHARRTVPDDLCFDRHWLQSPRGWCWIAQPIELPQLAADDLQLWQTVNAGPMTFQAFGWANVETDLGGTMFYIFGAYQPRQWSGQKRMLMTETTRSFFVPWSYFQLRDGERLGTRMEEFESKTGTKESGSYAPTEGVVAYPLHEMRWIYVALYLMAQRMARTETHQTDRTVRRRAEREGTPAPPVIRVITLRRLAQDRPKPTTPGQTVNWHWQWEVRGHWRNQWYRKEGVHRPKFIEAYVKGPADKPLKEGHTKLFAAVR